MKHSRFIKSVITAGALAVSASTAFAQDVTLRMHQFLPPQAGVPANILIPWAEKVTADSGGKLKVEVFSAMALGGTPPQLIDQARDGVVDIVWTLPGYTPGRFPSVEVFELPFMMTDAEAASRAYWELFKSDMEASEFKDLKILGTWVHGPGVLQFGGDTALYTAAFVLAMNKAKFDSLSDEMKAVLEANSGLEFSGNAGKVMQGLDA